MLGALALALAVASAQATPQPMRFLHPSRPVGAGGAFFEFAPADGLGMTAACAASAITGTKGETLTLTRAGSTTCMKGSPTTGIAEGDMVTVASNLPRVSVINGLKVVASDPTATNLNLRSETLENAYYGWSASGGASVPTITANAGVAPSGATTAERVQLGATTAAQTSEAVPTVAGAGGSGTPFTCSLYIRGRVASGTVDLCLWAGGAYECAACAFTQTTYNRCVKTYSSTVGSSRAYRFGNVSAYNGGTARSAADLDVFGAQCEENNHATAYVATVASSVARSWNDALTTTLAAQIGDTGSAAVTFYPLHTGAPAPCGGNCGGPNIWTATGNGRMLYGSTPNVKAYDGTNNPSVAANWVALTGKRYCSRWSTAGGWVLKNVTDALSTTATFTAGTWATSATSLNFLAFSGILPSGYIGQVCWSRTDECCPP